MKFEIFVKVKICLYLDYMTFLINNKLRLSCVLPTRSRYANVFFIFVRKLSISFQLFQEKGY